MIKCPECGHQVSDRAPYCPSCGVEIAGHVVKCNHCGEIHLKEDITCPNCHHNLVGAKEEQRPSAPTAVATVASEEVKTQPQKSDWSDRSDWEAKVEEPKPQKPKVAKPIIETAEPIQQAVPVADAHDNRQKEKQKKNYGALIIAFLIAAIICAVMLYMYRDAQTSNELKQYELAMKSTEPLVLQTYLDNYGKTNQAHAKEVQNKLNFLAQQKAEPKEKVEEVVEDTSDDDDWQMAVKENSEDSYARYKVQHPDGKHNAEADEALKKFARATIVNDDDESRAMKAVRTVLRAINGRSKEKLTGAFTSSITYNGQDEESPQAVVDYMEHLYNNVERLNWYLDSGSPKVTKAENQDLTITVPARLSQNIKGGANAQNYFNIRATLNTEGRITAITFTRLATPVKTEKKGE